ncbi:hypothetical protein CDL15_Pgr011778 [Punica granatum]|uniref:Uncharacterized protein n=1 Tax=Punica granatum TaxID=22663 RepID=A0A218XEF7_PUNGR|nr:hypothetical protein CDL15_Pgr011778 [Punica granatum]
MSREVRINFAQVGGLEPKLTVSGAYSVICTLFYSFCLFCTLFGPNDCSTPTQGSKVDFCSFWSNRIELAISVYESRIYAPCGHFGIFCRFRRTVDLGTCEHAQADVRSRERGTACGRTGNVREGRSSFLLIRNQS